MESSDRSQSNRAPTKKEVATVPSAAPTSPASGSVSLSELQGVLLDLALKAPDKASAIAEATRIIADCTNVLGTVYFERIERGGWRPFETEALQELNTTFGLSPDHWQTWCDQAAATCRLQHHLIEGALPMTVIAVPVAVPGERPEVLCAAFRTAKKPGHAVVLLMQNVAAHLTMWLLRCGYRSLDWELGDLAALIELVANIEQAKSLPHAALIAANQLQNYLECQRVAVGLVQGEQQPCQLQALSGISKFDKRSAYVARVEAALDEAILRNEVTVWPADGRDPAHPALAHQDLGNEADCSCVISAPLRTVDGRLVGAWLLLNDAPRSAGTPLEALLRAASPTVASSLALMDEARCGVGKRLTRSLYGHLRSRWLKVSLITAVVLAGFMCLPLRYQLKCDATIEPVLRRFVAAPFESTLQKTLVKPGDLVDKGTPLALLDGLELRMQLAGLEADLKQASKQRDAALAARKTHDAQIARLEMQSLELKIGLLRHRSSQLQIESPTSGIVVSGDLERVEGAPLQVGQTMFEIAPLNNMIVEVAIPESEIAHVRNNLEVQTKIAAYPGHTWSGTINRIHPRSEIRDGESVFVGEVQLQDGEGLLRPGMHGEARIIADRRAWGWILFHRAWNAVQFRLGW